MRMYIALNEPQFLKAAEYIFSTLTGTSTVVTFEQLSKHDLSSDLTVEGILIEVIFDSPRKAQAPILVMPSDISSSYILSLM